MKKFEIELKPRSKEKDHHPQIRKEVVCSSEEEARRIAEDIAEDKLMIIKSVQQCLS